MEGKQLLLFTTTVVCLVISTIVVTSRAIVRFAIRGFGLDDWLVAGSQVWYPLCVQKQLILNIDF